MQHAAQPVACDEAGIVTPGHEVLTSLPASASAASVSGAVKDPHLSKPCVCVRACCCITSHALCCAVHRPDDPMEAETTKLCCAVLHGAWPCAALRCAVPCCAQAGRPPGGRGNKAVQKDDGPAGGGSGSGRGRGGERRWRRRRWRREERGQRGRRPQGQAVASVTPVTCLPNAAVKCLVAQACSCTTAVPVTILQATGQVS